MDLDSQEEKPGGWLQGKSPQVGVYQEVGLLQAETVLSG